MSAGSPYRWTGSSAAVFGVTTSSTRSGSTLKSAPMSANRTVAPVDTIALTVAMKVNGLVTTSAPGGRSSAFNAATRATVPLDTATACATSVSLAKRCSNSSTTGPCASRPDRRTLSTARSSAAPNLTWVTSRKSVIAPVPRHSRGPRDAGRLCVPTLTDKTDHSPRIALFARHHLGGAVDVGRPRRLRPAARLDAGRGLGLPPVGRQRDRDGLRGRQLAGEDRVGARTQIDGQCTDFGRRRPRPGGRPLPGPVVVDDHRLDLRHVGLELVQREFPGTMPFAGHRGLSRPGLRPASPRTAS